MLLPLALMLLVALACEVQPSDYTPSAPQATAGALNATHEARATQTAAAMAAVMFEPSHTAKPDTSPSPTDVDDDSIVEVTVIPTTAIIEIGTPIGLPLPAPGEIREQAGRYTANKLMKVRDCEATTCNLIGWIQSGETVVTQGITQNELRQYWVCIEVSHVGPAQLCSRAVGWMFPDGWFGSYEVIQ